MKIIWVFILMLCVFSSHSSQEISSAVDEKILKLQILLDQNNFSPGKIDGLNETFTKEALYYYSRANKAEAESKMPIADEPPLYTSYIIRKEDENYIGKSPEKPAAQAKRKSLPYTSFVEMIAERFHTDLNFLNKINPGKDLKQLKVGDEVKVPNVKPFLISEVNKKKAEKKKNFSNRSIIIDSKKRLLFLYEDHGKKLLAVFPITPGSKKLPAPKGKWKIKSITYLPWFRYDKQMLQKGTRSRHYYNIPPGPNNAVGVVWIALNKKGIGIHGTEAPETIGRSVSHGCIRLTNWDAIKLSKMITKGMTVQID